MHRSSKLSRCLFALAFFAAGAPLQTAPCSPGHLQREEYTRTFQKTVAWQQGQSVRIDHRNGDIVIRTHRQPDIRVDASIRVSADDKTEAASFGDQIQIQIESAASAVSIRTSYPESRSGYFTGRRNISFSVSYDIAMPENAPLYVVNRFGNVTVSNLKAAADINNAHGLLTFRDNRGNHRLENSFAGWR